MDKLETIICDQKPDIISLLEFFPKYCNFLYIPSEYTIESYSMFLSFWKRGTALCIKDDLRVSTSVVAEFVFEESTWCEAIFVEGTNFSWVVCIGVLSVALHITVNFSKCLKKSRRSLIATYSLYYIILLEISILKNQEDRNCHSDLLSDPYKLLDKVTTLGWTQHIMT